MDGMCRLKHHLPLSAPSGLGVLAFIWTGGRLQRPARRVPKSAAAGHVQRGWGMTGTPQTVALPQAVGNGAGSSRWLETSGHRPDATTLRRVRPLNQP